MPGRPTRAAHSRRVRTRRAPLRRGAQPSRSRTPALAATEAALISSCVLPKAVTDAAHRLDRAPAVRPVDLLAEVADVDVDEVGATFVADVPGSFEQLQAGEDLAAATHEELEQ